MDTLLDLLGRLDGAVPYLLLGLLVLGESAVIVALLMPGEIALVVAGVLVAQGRVTLPLVLLVAIPAAVAGHAIGYELGRRHGLRLMSLPLLRRHTSSVDAAAGLVARRGASAVVLGRWTNVGRIVVPLLAGASRMPYGRFALANVAGGVAWVVAFVLLGAGAGASLDALEATLGNVTTAATVATVAFLVAAAVAVVVRRRRRDRAPAGPGGLEARGALDRAERAPREGPLCTVPTAPPSAAETVLRTTGASTMAGRR